MSLMGKRAFEVQEGLTTSASRPERNQPGKQEQAA
jgi:hypothetical protein